MLRETFTERTPTGGLGINAPMTPGRSREKELCKDPKSLSDAELVALFLQSRPPKHTALDDARRALAVSGGLRKLLDLDHEELSRLPGFGPARYVVLQAGIEVGRRYLAAQLDRGTPLTTTKEVSRFLTAKLRHFPFEVFSCLFLDNRHRIIRFEELFRGTVDGTTVHTREVVRRTLHHNATAVIFAHNHPCGRSEPSHEDRMLTDQLANALTMVEVRVLDHVVVGDGECTSFADRGWL